MVQKVKEKKSELQCYINGPENLSVSKTYLIKAFIILLFSSKLQIGLPYINWLTSKLVSSFQEDLSEFVKKMAMQEIVNS